MTPAAASRPAKQGATIALAGGGAVALATVALLASLSSHEYLGYDSIWHVFIARQESWSSFFREVSDNAHPPVFYLLLKGAIKVLGKSLLAYRAWSILAVAATTLLLARLTSRVTGNAPLAIAAAAAFGLSANIFEVGLEVRSYAVFLAFALVALSAYIQWLGARPGRATPQTRATFAAALSAAILSHYSAFFLLGGMIAAPSLLYAIHPRWRIRLTRDLQRHGAAAATMFGVPVAVGIAAFVAHVRHLPHGFNHVAEFMLDRRLESLPAFILRTTRSLVLLFIPGAGMQGLAGTLLAIVLMGGLCWLMMRRSVRGRGSVVPFVLLAVMALLNLAAGLAGRYPYGGYMRHELFLFPVAILCLFTAIEVARRTVPVRWSSSGLWTGVAALGVAANVWLALTTLTLTSMPLRQEPMKRFEGYFGKPPAVLMTDQFNFIFVFGEFHEWTWHLRWEQPGRPMWQVWDVSRGGQRFEVCREREWQSDFTQPGFYASVASCLQQAAADRVAVFRPQQGGNPAPRQISAAPERVRKLAEAAGMEAVAVHVDGEDVYAQFSKRAPQRKADEAAPE